MITFLWFRLIDKLIKRKNWNTCPHLVFRYQAILIGIKDPANPLIPDQSDHFDHCNHFDQYVPPWPVCSRVETWKSDAASYLLSFPPLQWAQAGTPRKKVCFAKRVIIESMGGHQFQNHLKVNCAIVVHVVHPECTKVILLVFSICRKSEEKVPEHVFSEMRSIGARVALLHQVPEYFNNYFHFIHWPSFWYPTNSTKIWMIIPIGLYCI